MSEPRLRIHLTKQRRMKFQRVLRAKAPDSGILNKHRQTKWSAQFILPSIIEVAGLLSTFILNLTTLADGFAWASCTVTVPKIVFTEHCSMDG